jgi:hypothetical protein
MAILEGLDQTDWGTLRHVSGPAEDIPTLLRQIASTDWPAQEAAFAELEGRLFHQFSIYSATVAAVPYLLQCLADPSFTLREDLLRFLSLLASLGGGDQTWWAAMQQDPGAFERHIDALVERAQPWDVPGYRACIGDEIIAAHQVFPAVRAGLPLYRAFLHDAAREVRVHALELLTSYRDDGVDSLPAVRAQIEREQDEAVLADLVNGLGLLSDASPWCLDLCGRLLSTHASPAVRLGAANTLVRLSPSTAPPEAIAAIGHAYAARDEDDRTVWPLHINAPLNESESQMETDVGIQGLTVDQVVALATIMLRGLDQVGRREHWPDDYGRRVERLCTLLFALPATAVGADARLDSVRQALIAGAVPILTSHLAIGPYAWAASYSAEVLVHLA